MFIKNIKMQLYNYLNTFLKLEKKIKHKMNEEFALHNI